jgi:hypothetical protein
MSNYSAVVVEIKNLRPHSNADRLVCTNIFGNNIIVGKETKVGDVGLYFPLESQLGEQFAKANDLIRRKDENGKPAGGMFDANRRVRAQTFRGEKSMGFFIPLESLNKLFDNGKALETFIEGQEIDEYLGIPIANKYIPRTNVSGTGKQREGRKPRESKIIQNQFRFHFDTAQLGRNIHKINPDDTIVLTWKMHGTSAIVSNCMVKKDLGFFTRLLSKFIPMHNTEYQYIYASRKVIKNEFAEAKQHFYGTDLWSDIGGEHFGGKLHKGETVYYEIVGYTKGGGAIQGQFDYGCAPLAQTVSVLPAMIHLDGRLAMPVEQVIKPQHKVYVYRITMTNPDGIVTELQWNQVKERCGELGVNYVPEIFYGTADITYLPSEDINKWRDDFLSYLQMKYVYDQDSQFCVNKVPEEGICVRKEGLNIEVFKLKSFRFLEGETKALDSGEVDTETAES